MAGPGGVLVGRGYVVIRPEFTGDWDRRVSGQTSRSGASGGRSFGAAFAKGASAGLSGLGGIVKASLAGSGIAAATVGIQQLGAAALAASAVAVPALSAIGTAGAAIGVGLKGVGKAFKAFDSAASDAKAAASATRAVESAQRSLARAQQAVGEARVSAARRVQDAERAVIDAQRDAVRAHEDVADAQRDALDVQKELSDAYKDAARQLEDYRIRLADAAIDQEEAAQRVKDAEKDLADARKDNDKDAIAKAELAVKRAKLSAEQQALDHKRLREEEAAATKAGVDGSAQVLAAKDRIADANDRVKDAAERAAEADRQVTDARRGVAEAHADGARQIADANEAVADAARALADAQQAAASQVSKVDEALAKLTPNAREFVETVKDLGPAWGEVRKATQESLFAGVAQSFRSMSTQIIPDLKAGLSGAATQISAMWRTWMDGVRQLSQEGSLKKFFDGNSRILEDFAKWPEEATRGWVQLSIAATPALERITTAVGEASTRLSERMDRAFASGAMESAISGAVDKLGSLKGPLSDIRTIFGNIFDSISGPGTQVLGGIGVALDELARVTSKPEVKESLTSIFTSFASISGTVLKALGRLVEWGLPLLATGLEWVARALPPVVDWLGRFAAVTVDKIGSGIGAAASGTRDFFDAFRGGDVGAQASAIERMGAASRSFSDKAGGYIRSFFDGFRDGELKSKWFVAKPGLGDVFDRAGTAARGVGDLLRQQVLPAFLELGRGIQSFLTPVVEAFGRIWTEHVQHILERVATVISRALVPIFKALGEFIRDRVSPALEELGGKFAGLLDKLAPIISVIDQVVTWLVKLGSEVLGFVVPVLIRLAGPVFTFLIDVIGFAIDVIGFAVDAITWLGRAAKWLWDEAIKPAFEGIGAAAKWLWDEVLSPVVGWIGESLRGWGLIATWLWDEILKPVFDGIGGALTWLWDNTIGPVVGWITESLRGWGLIATWLWNEAIKPTWDNIARATNWLWENGIKPPFESAKAGFRQLGEWAQKLHDEWIKPWFDKISNTVGVFVGGLVSAFSVAKTMLGTVWDGVTRVIASPIQWVIDHVYGGIRTVWNFVADKVGLPGLPEGPKIPGFATGGIYPGYTPGRDVGLAAVSGGEAIMRPEWTRAVGPGYVNAANEAAISGGVGGVQTFLAETGTPFMGAYGIGGIVGKVVKATAGALGHIPGVDIAAEWAKSLARGAVAKGVEIALKPIRAIVGKLPDSPDLWRLAKNVPLKLMDAFVDKVKGEDAKALGGENVQRALDWARSQAGKPYQWGGSGDPSWDCSGFMAAIQQVILGKKPTRLFTTFDFDGARAPAGWQQNLQAPFMVGVTNSGVGHMAGTLAGTNVESRGGDGVVVGPFARAWNSPMFSQFYGFAPSVGAGGGVAPTGALADWITSALKATGTPPPGSFDQWMRGMGVLVNRESGGNVFAINTTDSNAAASNASRGLAQVIPTTFNAFHQIGTPWDIYDPVANLAASINWIKYKYGSIANVQQANPNLPPKGYSFGGIVPRGGGTHDSGGWLEHGQLGLNMSGTPEAVLTGPDYALMRAAAVANNRGLGIGDVHVYVGDREIEDIVRVELRDFSGAVVGALDDGRG
ncbi:transglycosylase SLT domain-containing protein [Streptomycetaceae bacterium NBC_01309]